MTSNVEAAALLVHHAEQSLNIKLADPAALNGDLNSVLQKFRLASEHLIIADLVYATQHNVESQLWVTHVKMNDRYRKQLRRLRDSGRNTAVEKRKLLKDYLEFLKASQRHYRQHALQLDRMYGGIAALRREAQNWRNEMYPSTPLPSITQESHSLVLPSCHQTLVQLGDLSRYRATEIDEKPNWSHAVGYYNLANEILPESPVAHNQLAIIARTEKDHFKILYHLYRSAATKENNPVVRANLDHEFRRVRTAWGKGGLDAHGYKSGSTATSALITWFVRLHSKCHTGDEFAEHEELEGEVISQMIVHIKEQSFKEILQRMILSNIAAEYVATMRLRQSPEDDAYRKAYFYFLRLNVKTFFALLQVLQTELETLAEDHCRDDVFRNNSNLTKRLSEKITIVARRALPAVRLYGMWFLQYWRILESNVATTMTETDVQELFKAYASTMTLLASVFPSAELPPTSGDYLLEEDADTVGFNPLIGDATHRYWYSDGQLKKRWSDRDVEQLLPKDEMLVRIRDLLVDGLDLSQNEQAPIDLVGLRFIYREKDGPSELLASPQHQTVHSPELAVEIADIPHAAPADDQRSRGLARSDSNSILSKDTALHRMVDNLVNGDDGLDPLHEEDENAPPTPPAQTFDDTVLVNNNSYGLTPRMAHKQFVQGSPNSATPGSPAFRQVSLPSLPDQSGIWHPDASNGFTPHSSHSRHASLNSNSHSPRLDTYSSVTMPRSSAGAIYGYGVHSNLAQAAGLVHDPDMASSMLFGRTAPSPWAAPGMERNSASLGRTPPQGQAG